MLRARHLIPLIIPVLLIGIPSIAYVIDSRSGAIPTQAQWESAAHSSGPWMSSWVFDACALLGFGGIIITGVGAAFAATTQRDPKPWAIQGVGIVIASAVVFYFYGWLFE
jgi:hypothetical protein